MNKTNPNQNISYEEALIRAGFSLAVLSDLGFESAKQTRIPQKISQLSPSGSTSMRDAVLEGITLLLNLNTILIKLGTNHVWNFIHIVLTDGEDTSSKTTVDETCAILGIINMTIPERMLKTWFVGIDLKENDQSTRNINKFCSVGNKNTEFMNVSDLEISSIFEKISIQLGIQERYGVIGVQNPNNNEMGFLTYNQQSINLNVSEQKFVVLFTLDMSGSMVGTRWRKVCESVDRFVRYLGKDDLVAAVVFNDKVQTVTSSGLHQVILPMPKQNTNYRPRVNNNANAAYINSPSPYYDFEVYKRKENKVLNGFVYFVFIVIVIGVVIELLRDFNVLRI